MPHGPWTHEAICQISITGSALGSQIVNTMHFEASGAADAAMTDDALAISWGATLVDHWITNLKTTWLAAHPPDYVMSMIRAQVLERKGYRNRKLTATERPQTTANVGTGLSACEYAASCIVLKWRSAVAGKKTRGRMYLGPVGAGQMENGIVGATQRTQYDNFRATQEGMYKAGGTYSTSAIQTVYSRPYDQGDYQYTKRVDGNIVIVVPVDYDGDSNNVIAAQYDWTLRSQRRRNLGVGA
jgi:hypothetical protein